VAGLREPFAREGDRAQDGEGELAAAYREGQTLPSREVAAMALALLEEATRAIPLPGGAPASTQSPEPSSQPPELIRSPLSAREAAVLQLVAQGLTSKEIGRQLYLAPSTVNYHLTAVFNKLGVDTRAQAVAIAAQRGLL
jgi:DNA-binding NarL/FixJ family response regulator